MDNLNKYMDNVSTLSSLRDRVQYYVNLKEDYLKKEKLVILSSIDLEDVKKVADRYKSAVDRNNDLYDLLIDIKNEIFKMRLIKESLDKNTAIGISQIKSIDNLINILNEIISILTEEKSKLDRIVRFYEKESNYYNNY